MGVIINLLEKVNTLVYKKVPYQAYLILSFIMIAVVAQYVYDYNTQPKDLTDWSKIRLAELEPAIVYPYENQIGWSNPKGLNGEQIFDYVTGKPLEDNN